MDDIREGKTPAPIPRALHDVHMTPEIQEYLERKLAVAETPKPKAKPVKPATMPFGAATYVSSTLMPQYLPDAPQTPPRTDEMTVPLKLLPAVICEADPELNKRPESVVQVKPKSQKPPRGQGRVRSNFLVVLGIRRMNGSVKSNKVAVDKEIADVVSDAVVSNQATETAQATKLAAGPKQPEKEVHTKTPARRTSKVVKSKNGQEGIASAWVAEKPFSLHLTDSSKYR